MVKFTNTCSVKNKRQSFVCLTTDDGTKITKRELDENTKCRKKHIHAIQILIVKLQFLTKADSICKMTFSDVREHQLPDTHTDTIGLYISNLVVNNDQKPYICIISIQTLETHKIIQFDMRLILIQTKHIVRFQETS